VVSTLIALLYNDGEVSAAFSFILSVTIFVAIIVGLSLDRRWIRLTPLTPLSVALFGIFLRSVFGPLLMSAGDSVSLDLKSSVMIAFRSNAQLLWLAFAVFLILPYVLWTNRSKEVIGAERFVPNERVISIFVIATGLFSLTWMYTGLLSGSASRDPALYDYWVGRFFKPDAAFIAFGRLRDSFYFLVPLAFFVIQRYWTRVAIAAIVILNIYAALELGGRGIVLLPILEMYFGFFLLGLNKRKLILSSCLMLVIGLSGSQMLVGNHKLIRNGSDVVDELPKTLLDPSSLVRTGVSLYGCSDAYNFTLDNSRKPGAGWVRSERWLTAWLPSFARGSSNRSSRDAHIIAEQLERGIPAEVAESMDYRSFSCVSFVGDLFWRWRWIGVIIGTSAFGLMYYIFTIGWRRVIALDSLSGCLAFCFPVSFLTLYPSGSVGETFWLWTWDIQKYILLFLLLRILDNGSRGFFSREGK